MITFKYVVWFLVCLWSWLKNCTFVFCVSI